MNRLRNNVGPVHEVPKKPKTFSFICWYPYKQGHGFLRPFATEPHSPCEGCNDKILSSRRIYSCCRQVYKPFVETMVHTNIHSVTCNDCLIKHWGRNSLPMGVSQPILNEVECFHLYFNKFFRSSLPTRISIRKSSNRNEGRENP